MTILALNALNEKQKQQVLQLEQQCKQYDGLKRSAYLSCDLNFNAEINCYFLLYEQQALISFLFLFLPTPIEAEVSAYTLPEHRRRGYFTKLIESAKTELKKHGISEMLLVNESISTAGKSAIEKTNARYEYSEYLLTLQHPPSALPRGRLVLKEAEREHIKEMAQISCEAFGGNLENSIAFAEKALKDEKRVPYIALLDGTIIGTCGVNFEAAEVYIFGVAISPAYQGKGYGQEMMLQLLKKLNEMNVAGVALEVNSQNDRAFHLYQQCGFAIQAQMDYYRILF